MSCGLVAGVLAVRLKAARAPAFGRVTRCVDRGRRWRWRHTPGGYLLYRGAVVASIDENYPVGLALAGVSQVGELLDARPVSDGQLSYRVRGFGPLGVEDGAADPDAVTVDLVAGVVQLPKPNPPIEVRAEPYNAGRIVLTVLISNAGAPVNAKWLVAFSDNGSGLGVDYDTPLGDPYAVGGDGVYQFVVDPALAHGTVVEVGVRTRSADGADAANVDTSLVRLDAAGPPAIADMLVECA